MDELTNCPFCHGELERISDMRPVKVTGRKVRVRHDLFRCSLCNTELFGPGDMDAVLIRARDIVRAGEGLLMPREILALRNSLGLSQQTFEQLLGLGAKTVVRWERGTVFQSKAADNLLRVLRDVPHAANYLGLRNNVSVQRADQLDQKSIELLFTTATGFVAERQAPHTRRLDHASVAGMSGLANIRLKETMTGNESLALAS